MTNYDDARRLRRHADEFPLVDRLRGRHFIPGMHYVTQAQAWMAEAADEIERLSAPPKIETVVPISKEVPTQEAAKAARGSALDAIDRMLVMVDAVRLRDEEAWTELRKIDENYPHPFLMNVDVVKIRWKMVPR